jgi:hypothetical protein
LGYLLKLLGRCSSHQSRSGKKAKGVTNIGRIPEKVLIQILHTNMKEYDSSLQRVSGCHWSMSELRVDNSLVSFDY